ncbi:MAG TPA: nuclear transport factor 2 family protein [Acidimicrobiia bacterium]|nr:nuclear transport factor 2 family protein [Acidimicrobiia bacterium]
MTDDTRRARNLETANRLLALMGQMDVEQMLEHYADDVVVELPYAPGGMPKVHAGKDAAIAFMREAKNFFSSYTSEVDAVYPAADDPDTVLAEVRGHGVAAPTGRPYEQTYVLVLRFAPDGKLRLWREYYDPGVVIKAFGNA